MFANCFFDYELSINFREDKKDRPKSIIFGSNQTCKKTQKRKKTKYKT